MLITRLLYVLCALPAILLSSSANSALVSALNGSGVFDTVRNITYLSDPISAQTSGYDPDSLMTASAAQTYVGYLNSTFYLGFNDWRLPTTLIADANCTDDTAGSTPSSDAVGFNCNGGELGHLFYDELGGVAGSSISDSTDTDLDLFEPIPDGVFWTSTENPNNSSEVFTFLTINGFQNVTSKSFSSGRAWVVRNGGADTVDPVPVPAAIWLFASGLLGLIGIARRKKAA